MAIPVAALDLENRHIGPNGEPTLADAFGILRKQWELGDRDRELGLHLLFISWYGNAEPPSLTGFLNSPEADLQQTFSTVFNYFQPKIHGDAEMLFVIGIAAIVVPWALGDEKVWEMRAREYLLRYRELMPNGLDPSVFRNRGYYGEYYRGHVEGGSFTDS